MWLWPKFAHSKMSPSSYAPYNNFIKGLLIQQNAKFQQSMLSLKFYLSYNFCKRNIALKPMIKRVHTENAASGVIFKLQGVFCTF